MTIDANNPTLSNIGRMVEDMEIKLRTTLELIYFGKTKDIVNDLRNMTGLGVMRQRKEMQKQIGIHLASKN